MMDNEELMHDLIIDRLRRKFAREYKEIRVNREGDPDIALSNHGLTIAVVEVETENSITPEKAKIWRELSRSGSKLILIVPHNSKAKTMELLWEQGIADKVGIGSYEIKITMP
jgi:hypothetical protein